MSGEAKKIECEYCNSANFVTSLECHTCGAAILTDEEKELFGNLDDEDSPYWVNGEFHSVYPVVPGSPEVPVSHYAEWNTDYPANKNDLRAFSGIAGNITLGKQQKSLRLRIEEFKKTLVEGWLK